MNYSPLYVLIRRANARFLPTGMPIPPLSSLRAFAEKSAFRGTGGMALGMFMALYMAPQPARAENFTIDNELKSLGIDASYDELEATGFAQLQATGTGAIQWNFQSYTPSDSTRTFLFLTQTATGAAQLGSRYRVFFDEALPLANTPDGVAPIGWQPIVKPSIVANSVAGDSNLSFLQQDSVTGEVTYASGVTTDLNAADAFSIVSVNSTVALGGSKTVYALSVRQNITASAGTTLTIGSGGLLFAHTGASRRIEPIIHFGNETGYIFGINDSRVNTITRGIEGSNGVVVGGTQNLRLQGSLNTFTGELSIIGGLVYLNGNATSGAGVGLNRESGYVDLHVGELGQFNLTGARQTIGSLSGSGLVNNQSVTIDGVSNSAVATELEINIATAKSDEFSGQITDNETTPLSVTLKGGGTLILSGNGNDYHGATTVDEGRLVVNGSILQSSGVTVETGGILAGSGQINSATTIKGTLAPGNSPGTLTFLGDLAFEDLAVIEFELGMQSDELHLGGMGQELSFEGTTQFDFSLGTGFVSGQDYVIFRWNDPETLITGFDPAHFLILNPGIEGNFAIEGNTIVFSVIPEPTNLALLGVGLLSAVMALRRRRRGALVLSLWVASMGCGMAVETKAELMASKEAPDPTALILKEAHGVLDSGASAKAREVYLKLISGDALNAEELGEAYLGLGSSYMLEGNFLDAMEVFSRGIEANSYRPSLRYRMKAQFLFSAKDAVNETENLLLSGQAKQAAAKARAILAREDLPGTQRDLAQLSLGRALAQLGENKEAEACLLKLVGMKEPQRDRYREYSAALVELTRLLLQQGRLDEARGWTETFSKQSIVFEPHREELLSILSEHGLSLKEEAKSVYGASAIPGHPIGGGDSYESLVTSGDFTVTTQSELLKALRSLAAMNREERHNKIVFIPSDAVIDLTGEKEVLIPSGVTLASDRGHNGSAGGKLTYEGGSSGTDWLLTMEKDSRVCGLQLIGPIESYETWHGWSDQEFQERVGPGSQNISSKISAINIVAPDARVDNCRIERFFRGIGTSAENSTIQNNLITNISWYPIVLLNGGRSTLIEYNDITWMWHAVVTTFSPFNSYLVRNNIFRESTPNRYADGMSMQFAVESHGMGDSFIVHNNTFMSTTPGASVPNRSVCIMLPQGFVWVNKNWFADYMTADNAAWDRKAKGREVFNPEEGGRQLAGWRDIGYYANEHLKKLTGEFDFRELAAMTRGKGGGASFWIWDNAYGPQKDVLETTMFTTPEIVFRSPIFRRWQALGMGENSLVKTDRKWPLRLNPVVPIASKPFPVIAEVAVLPKIGLRRVNVRLFEMHRLQSGDNSPRVSIEYWPPSSTGTLLYTGPKVPSPGEVVVDPTTLVPGVYAISIEAEDNRGIRAGEMSHFRVAEHHESK